MIIYFYRKYVLQHFRGFKTFLLALTANSGQVRGIKITVIKHIFNFKKSIHSFQRKTNVNFEFLTLKCKLCFPFKLILKSDLTPVCKAAFSWLEALSIFLLTTADITDVLSVALSGLCNKT